MNGPGYIYYQVMNNIIEKKLSPTKELSYISQTVFMAMSVGLAPYKREIVLMGESKKTQ